MLAHLCRHGANLYSQRGDRGRAEVLREIRLGFDQVWNSDASGFTGSIVEGDEAT